MAIQDWIAKGGKSAALSFVLLKRVTRITLFENCQKVSFSNFCKQSNRKWDLFGDFQTVWGGPKMRKRASHFEKKTFGDWGSFSGPTISQRNEIITELYSVFCGFSKVVIFTDAFSSEINESLPQKSTIIAVMVDSFLWGKKHKNCQKLSRRKCKGEGSQHCA